MIKFCVPIKDFFYSFMPRVLKGSRANDVYSSMRLMMVGCFTAAFILSGLAMFFFMHEKKEYFVFSLVLAWLIPAIILSILVKMRDKDRVELLKKGVNLLDHTLNKNDRTNNTSN